MSVKEVKSVYEGGLYRVILSFTEKKKHFVFENTTNDWWNPKRNQAYIRKQVGY